MLARSAATVGDQQLKPLLNARVRASATVVQKQEPMELKMPVGDTTKCSSGWRVGIVS